MNAPDPHRLLRLALLTALLVAVTFMVYRPALDCGFVDYDDPLYVTENTAIQEGFTARGLQSAWRDPVAGNWHPVTMLSHLLDVQLHGLDPRGHHLTSITLHALNCGLLFLLLNQLFGGWVRPALVALLFCVHPLNVDSVVWIAERKNVLSTFFWLAATLLYALNAQAPSAAKTIGVAALFQLGLMSKPMLVTLPFTLLLLDYYPLRRVEGFAREHWPRWKQLAAEKSALWLLGAIACVITLSTQFTEDLSHGPEAPPIWARAAFALEHYCLYLAKFLWPTGLCALHPRLAMPPTPGTVLLSGLLLTVLSCCAFLPRRKAPALLVGWCWFLGTLFPVIGLVSIGHHSISERYMYVPMIGLLIALAWGLVPPSLVSRKPVAVFGVSLALAAAALTGWTSRGLIVHWRNSESLFRRALAVTTDNAVMHYNLGRQLMLQDRTAEAQKEFEEALRIQPVYHEALNNLGWALAIQGRHREAIAHFETALDIEPRNVQARLNLAASLVVLKRAYEARHQLELLLEQQPENTAARKALLELQARNR